MLTESVGYGNGAYMKRKIYAVLGALLVLFHVLVRTQEGFADTYRRVCFPFVVSTFSRMTGQFPFSVGEGLILAGLILTILLVLGALLFLFTRKSKKPFGMGFSKGYRRYAGIYAWILLGLGWIMSLNCYVFYGCSSFNDLYIKKDGATQEYTTKELIELRDYVIRQANALSKELPRDEKGMLIYEGDMEAQCAKEIERLGELYPQLSGYCPRGKGIHSSKFLSQQYIMGYYFPFSMEANYNTEMYIANVPATVCHELAHLHGFIYEDDANLIGYLACVTSEDPFFQYSGYLSVIAYLNDDLYKSLDKNKQLYKTYRQCNNRVKKDMVFLTKEAWTEVEKNAVVKTTTVKKASNAFLNANLNLNGVEEGVASYGEVVQRLLEYYEEN
ncbi:MAG: DUF3810 domain-containing protein [Lachnospiraceae bacterium]|nr:DUF3810 domain-containing protein [Lachnospiraceae bacterium]